MLLLASPLLACKLLRPVLPASRRGMLFLLSPCRSAADAGPLVLRPHAHPFTASESERLGGSQIDFLTVQDGLGEIDHGDATVHRAALETAKRIRLGPAVALHQNAFGPLNCLAALQRLAQRGVFLHQRVQLTEACPGYLHGWPELMRLNRLQQVSQNMLIHGTLDQSLVAIR